MSATAMKVRECAGCGADLTGAHGKRKWCSERCRRTTLYGGTCEACGTTTNGNNGPGTAPRLCRDCAPAANAKWPSDRIIEKIREWNDRYGTPPGIRDWNPAIAAYKGEASAPEVRARFDDGEWPWANTVLYHWPKWNDAIRAAGLTPRYIGLKKNCVPTKPPSEPTQENTGGGEG